MNWVVVFLVLALLSFILAIFGAPGPKGGWVSVGLALLTLSFLQPLM